MCTPREVDIHVMANGYVGGSENEYEASLRIVNVVFAGGALTVVENEREHHEAGAIFSNAGAIPAHFI